ncbi:PREDICTED: protein timeless homolog isoform X1 [Theobroma cacao]|uniref:Protein timeless homolog isoform X1 n=1 Tax=Theobroma cacao TaxID=3641 RepID=A0AB32VYT8_THECC|nr:PREDICTED: protein timeless homolog isoform X1 [Theobroma cacao]
MDMEGLSVICASLGILEEDQTTKQIVYTKGEHCLDALKDLLRFLRRDNPETREVFKQVCRWNIVSKNLIPIIEHWQHDRNLVLNAVKVLVFLSMPIEPSSSDVPQQIEYLWDIKFSLTGSDAVAVIVSLLEGPLENLEYEVFTEDDWKLVQLVVTLFRNVLAIQDFSLLQKAGQFLSLRDRFLELLFRENVMELIIVITQHIGGSRGYLRQDNLLLLETFHYIFMNQDPELLSKAHLKGSTEGGDAKACIDDLKSIMEEEAKKRRVSRLHHTGRHSQFSGTFTRLTMDGSTAVYKGNPDSASQNVLLKSHKGHGISTQKIVRGHGQLPSTRNNILELLHDFVNQFLSGGYNVLMKSIREDIEKEHHAIQKGDIIVFFKVAEFVTSFQYHKFLTSKPTVENPTPEVSADKCADSTFFKGDICGPIAASMNESMFQLVISRWRNAFEGLKETNDYKFLSAASSLMKNMIRMLDLVLNLFPEDSKEPRTARMLLYKLFYDQTDQGMTQFLLNLIKMFNSRKQPKSDLADLVEMMHLIIQLMENLQARGSLRVSKKSRKGRKKKVVSDNVTKSEQFEDHAAAPDGVGTSVCEQSAAYVSEKESPVKGTSDWKEDTSTPLLVDELGKSETKMECPGDLPQVDNNTPGHADDDLCCSTDDSSGDEQPATVNEVDFKVSTLTSAFANCSIIQNLCWLLKFYRSNSINTNHYILGMLRKITDDLELAPMLYQLSLLTTFYDILEEQKSCPSEEHADIVGFITSLVRNMLKKMKNQPLLFIEILFWKTRRECHYINAEYLLHELGHWKKGSKTQDSAPRNGEIGSSEASEWVGRSIADALGEDEADVVISHERGHLNESGWCSGENSMENKTGKINERKRRLVLNDDMETKLKELYENFKDHPNCIRLIAESLDPDGGILPAQVSNKLKQLGLKVAPKKRTRGSDQQGDKSTLHDSNDLEGSSQRQPLNTRKRVRAFSKDQEAMIKDLFEQYKDHRRCSYMIANALDADNMFTAAQVSRKLKQLGLHVPRQKRSEDNMHLRDEELNDLSADETCDSDNETLLSFRNRNKDKDRLFSQEFPAQNVEGRISDDTDDKTLSSVLKKTRKLPLNSKNEKLATITTRERIDKTSEVVVANDVTENDGSNQFSEIDVIFHQESRDTVNLSRVSTENIEGELAHQQAEDELADSGDDVASGSFVESTINRRKLRMVIDPEDDD